MRKRTGRKTRRKSTSVASAKRRRRWSAEVTRQSDALDLERGVFTRGSATEIAQSLKQSAERSGRRKAGPYRSAMSMLTFYINRAGRNLSESRKKVLARAKGRLRRLFGRDERTGRRSNRVP